MISDDVLPIKKNNRLSFFFFLELSKDEYILIADSGQGQVYQIPLNNKNETFYSLVPIGELLIVLQMYIVSTNRDGIKDK